MRMTINIIMMCISVLLATCAPQMRQVQVSAELDPYVASLSSTDPNERVQAAYALMEMGKEAMPVVPFLIQTLDDKRSVWMQKKKVTTRDGTEPGVEKTMDYMIKSINVRVNGAAYDALKSITGKDFGYDESRWRDWWNEGAN